ncbi:thioesterase family protein [Conexibacter sp. W3-3-2]|uniref:acyl-CoA thioesterase n=1 Tax=Conexibacter sp. W3-3-2 TaxID=2675227 RepID=UPI0012BA26C4|nr:thioesterase family protein [Conexibacter sp. W3-3-2]MTD46907.1 thioesterase family protein [Conexibacter sp. W3-3-2]
MAGEDPHFGRDSAVEPLGDGRYRAFVTPSWSAPVGPNGGYIAAMVIHAIEAQVADPARHLRSITLHYLRSPAVDRDAEVHVTVERSGRSVTTVTARLVQDDDLCILALAALSLPFPPAADYATAPPTLPPYAALPAVDLPEQAPEIAHRLDIRYGLGHPPFSLAPEALTGGYVRLANPVAYDAGVLALLVDAWLPAPWCRLDAVAGAPTLDLTVHFRAPEVALALDPATPLIGRYRSGTSRDGLSEEDAEIWAPDGTLLVQGRQLALLRARRDR